jgi:hypothetical protein
MEAGSIPLGSTPSARITDPMKKHDHAQASSALLRLLDKLLPGNVLPFVIVSALLTVVVVWSLWFVG